MTLLAALIILIINITLLGFVVFVIVLIFTLIRLPVPFVPVSSKTLDQIIRELRLDERSVLYDLGSGDGKVIMNAYTLQPNAQYKGIDIHWFPYFISKVKWLGAGRPANVEFLHKSFFNHTLNDATHVYVYLLPSMLEEILPKLQHELKPGTKLFSCDFKFKSKEPIKAVDLVGSKSTLSKKLYIYEF